MKKTLFCFLGLVAMLAFFAATPAQAATSPPTVGDGSANIYQLTFCDNFCLQHTRHAVSYFEVGWTLENQVVKNNISLSTFFSSHAGLISSGCRALHAKST